MFLETHCRLELNFMISWGMVSDKVIVVSAGGILRVLNVFSRLLGCYNKRRWLWLRMTSLQATFLFRYTWKLLRLIRIDREYLFSVIRKARQRTVNRTGSKMNCLELCDFHFCCAFIFCHPMKKFVFLVRPELFLLPRPGNEVARKLDVRMWNTE